MSLDLHESEPEGVNSVATWRCHDVNTDVSTWLVSHFTPRSSDSQSSHSSLLFQFKPDISRWNRSTKDKPHCCRFKLHDVIGMFPTPTIPTPILVQILILSDSHANERLDSLDIDKFLLRWNKKRLKNQKKINKTKIVLYHIVYQSFYLQLQYSCKNNLYVNK